MPLVCPQRAGKRAAESLVAVFTNWIANCEAPARLWPAPATWVPTTNGDIPLLLLNNRSGPAAPAPIGGLTAAELSKWHGSSSLFRRLYNNETCDKLAAYQGYVLKRRADQARPAVGLAEELYAREHGGQYPNSPQDLLGRYLNVLPGDVPQPAGQRASQAVAA